jgi:hypothetical protein
MTCSGRLRVGRSAEGWELQRDSGCRPGLEFQRYSACRKGLELQRDSGCRKGLELQRDSISGFEGTELYVVCIAKQDQYKRTDEAMRKVLKKRPGA